MNQIETRGHIIKSALIVLLLLAAPGFFGGSYILGKIESFSSKVTSLEKSILAEKANSKRKQASLKAKHKKQLSEIENNYRNKEKKLKESHKKEVAKLEESHLKKEAKLKNSHKSKEAKLKNSHKNDLAKLKTKERAKAKFQRAIAAVPLLGFAAFTLFETQEFNSWKEEHPEDTFEEYSEEIGAAVNQLLLEEYSEYHEEYQKYLELLESEQ